MKNFNFLLYLTLYFLWLDTNGQNLHFCNDTLVGLPNNDCEVTDLSFHNMATKNPSCASGDTLQWFIYIDLWGDGSNDYELSSLLPMTDTTFDDSNNNGIPDFHIPPTLSGQHMNTPTIPEAISGNFSNNIITYQVKDMCGGVTSCKQNLEIKDITPPIAKAYIKDTILQAPEIIILKAKDFDNESLDNCTGVEKLLFTFKDEHPVLSKLNEIHFFKGKGLNATEADYNQSYAQMWLPNEKTSSFVYPCEWQGCRKNIDIAVWDGKFNYSNVKLYLPVFQQNISGCDPIINVELETYYGESVFPVSINFIADLTAHPGSIYFDRNISRSICEDTIHIRFAKTEEAHFKGLEYNDMFILRNHILGIEPLTNPYQIIAADVNEDGKINYRDMYDLYLRITGLVISQKQWVFVPNEDYPIISSINVPSYFDFNSLKYGNAMYFTVVKLGDIDGSWKQ